MNTLEQLSSDLNDYIEKNKLIFYFDETLLHSHEVSSSYGAVVLFLMDAKIAYDHLYHNSFVSLKTQPTHTLPIHFKKQEDGTFFGIVPILGKISSEDYRNILAFTIQSLSSYAQTQLNIKPTKKNKAKNPPGSISLSPLYQQFVDLVNNEKITIID